MSEGNLPSTKKVADTTVDGNLPSTRRKAVPVVTPVTLRRPSDWGLAHNERQVDQYGPEWVKHAIAGGTIVSGNILVD